MPVGNWNLEWLNHNSQRAYPLADDTTALDQTGAFEVPEDFIVELDLPLHAGLNVDPARFFVRQIGAYSTGYSIFVGYQPASGSPVLVASALIPIQGHVKNTAYALGGIGDYADTVGKVVIGKLDSVNDRPPGFWTFDFAATRLDPDAARPIIRGVSSIVVINGDQESEPLYGDVELRAGTNIQLVTVVIDGADPIVRINAIRGEGTVDECVCEGDTADKTPITSINGVRPTPGGGLTLAGTTCLNVETFPHGIKLVDSCSAPCCGCAELERITTDLERFGRQADLVENFVSGLRTAVDTMSLTVLGSRLNDNGCVQCE